MNDAVQELRIRAEILQHRTQTQNPNIKRRDCLLAVAKQMGFLNWSHAKRVLSGELAEDYGSLLCPTKCDGHINLRYKTHTEADAVRRDRGGYLLAYRRQFLIVERPYSEALGLDPDDAGWHTIDFDWVRGNGNAVRARLYSKLVAGLPHE